MICKVRAQGIGNKCQDCGRIVCDHHGDWFRDCDVCSKVFNARVNKGCFINPTGGFSFFPVCPYCGNSSHKTRNEADGDSDDESEIDQPFYEEETCGFFYCEECFMRHEYSMSENEEKKRKIDSSDEQDSSPKPPYHVDLGKNELVKDTNSKDGSARHPFLTLNEAQIFLERTHWRSDVDRAVFAKCASTCDKVKCSRFGCKTMICKDHAEGFGFFDGSKGDFLFPLNKCQDCSCVACDHHRHTWLQECDVCSILWSCIDEGEGSFSDYAGGNCVFKFLVCPDCGTTCHKSWSEAGCSDGWNSEEETCEFYCCRTCFKDHECGHLYTMA